MNTLRAAVAGMLVVAGASLAQGQQPAPRANAPQGQQPPQQRMGPGMHSKMGPAAMPASGLASMLLARTAELKLTDQQVTRIAAIARRTDERHKAMRASMDSVMRAHRPQTGARGMAAGPMPAMGSPMMARMHEQERADVREALQVLSIDQQVDLWMMHSMAGHGMQGHAMQGHDGDHPMGPPQGGRPDK